MRGSPQADVSSCGLDCVCSWATVLCMISLSNLLLCLFTCVLLSRAMLLLGAVKLQPAHALQSMSSKPYNVQFYNRYYYSPVAGSCPFMTWVTTRDWHPLIAHSLSPLMQLTLIKIVEILGMMNKVCFFRFSVEIVPSPIGEPAPPSAHLYVFSTFSPAVYLFTHVCRERRKLFARSKSEKTMCSMPIPVT